MEGHFPLDLWSDGKALREGEPGRSQEAGVPGPARPPPCSETLAIPRRCSWWALCPAAQTLLSQLGCSPSSQVKAPPPGSRQGRARGIGQAWQGPWSSGVVQGDLQVTSEVSYRGRGEQQADVRKEQAQCMPGSSCSEQVLAGSAGCSWPVWEQAQLSCPPRTLPLGMEPVGTVISVLCCVRGVTALGSTWGRGA